MATKYYAVKVGKNPGIYTTWDKCKEQVNGYSGAIYKSFTSKDEAMSFMGDVPDTDKKIDNNIQKSPAVSETQCEEEAIAYVDGSYEKSINRYGYGCVILCKGNKVELFGGGNDSNLVSMNNVAGEILGSMNAINWAIENEVKSIRIFHDYEGISRWANGEWKANKPGTIQYQQFISKARQKITINFTKVAAHTGVELNERADQLAKQGVIEIE